MSTVASLQIKIGADVSAAISGLSRAEFAADQVKEAYIAANDATVRGGFAIAGWSQNFSTAISAVKRDLEQVDITKLDEGSKESSANMLALATGALRVSESVTVAASAFSGMQSIAGPAIAGIARLIPSIGVSLAALAGPIGLAVGLLAAGAAIVVSNWDLVSSAMSDADNITLQATNNIVEQDSKMRKLVATINDSTRSYQERSSALKEAQSISNTYFGSLDLEKSKVTDINAAYDGYIKNLKQASLAKVIAGEIEKEQAKLIDLEKTFNKRLAAGSGFSILPGVNLNDLTIGSFDGLNDDVQETSKNIDDLTKRLAGIEFTVDKKPNADAIGTKGIESEADKIQNVIDELGKSLDIIREKNKSGILPDDDVFKEQESSFKKAIDNIANINVNSDVFKNLVADYKSLAQAEEIQLPFTPVIKVDEVASITLAPLADRMKKVVEDKLSGIKILIDDTASLDSVKSFAEKFKKEIEAISQVADIAGQIGSALSGAIGQSNDNEFEAKRQALDAYYEREQELIETSIGSDTIKNRKKEQLDKEVSTKRKQIAREEAQSQKNLNIFEAVINTANAVTRALATGGPILAGIVGALGLAQISAISSAPLPALAGGGLVTGPSVVQVGEYPGAANNPEFISPVDKAQKYIREAVQQAGGSSAQQLFSYIDGDDIVLISERGNYRKQRLG